MLKDILKMTTKKLFVIMIIAQLVALGFGIFGIVKLVQQETIGAAYLIVAVGVICAIELDLLYEWLHNKKKK